MTDFAENLKRVARKGLRGCLRQVNYDVVEATIFTGPIVP